MGWGMTVCSNCAYHMTKMATMPIYDKNFKNLSSSEPNGQCHIALGTRVLPSLLK